MKELLQGIYQWSWFSAEKGIDFNGLYIRTRDEAILIDPPPLGEGDLEQIRWLGPPRAILITNRHHGRQASELPGPDRPAGDADADHVQARRPLAAHTPGLQAVPLLGREAVVALGLQALEVHVQTNGLDLLDIDLLPPQRRGIGHGVDARNA